MKQFVKDGKVYYFDMTPEEALELTKSKFLKRVKNMSNEQIIIAYVREIIKYDDVWKAQIIMKEILRRMS